MYRELSKF